MGDFQAIQAAKSASPQMILALLFPQTQRCQKRKAGRGKNEPNSNLGWAPLKSLSRGTLVSYFCSWDNHLPQPAQCQNAVPFLSQHAGEILTSSEVSMEEIPQLIQGCLKCWVFCWAALGQRRGALVVCFSSDEWWKLKVQPGAAQGANSPSPASSYSPDPDPRHSWFIWNASPCPHQLVTVLFSNAWELIISICFGVLSKQLEQGSISSLSILYIHYYDSRALSKLLPPISGFIFVSPW